MNEGKKSKSTEPPKINKSNYSFLKSDIPNSSDKSKNISPSHYTSEIQINEDLDFKIKKKSNSKNEYNEQNGNSLKRKSEQTNENLKDHKILLTPIQKNDIIKAGNGKKNDEILSTKSGKKFNELNFTESSLKKMLDYSPNNKKQKRIPFNKIFNYPREKTKVFWIIPNDLFESRIEEFKKFPSIIKEGKENMLKIKSDIFKTQNEDEWKLAATYQKDKNKIGFSLKVEKSIEEKSNPDWKRNASITLTIYQTNSTFEKTIEPNRGFNEENKEVGTTFALSNFEIQLQGNFVIELTIRPFRAYNYDSKEQTGFVGLVNAGNTCYMNSFLQTLYNLPMFTRCVFNIPILEKDSTSVQAALQQIFYNLKFSNKAVLTSDLLKSFGWESRDAWVQHDVQEFKCVLLDSLEEKTNSCNQLEISKLFGGKLVNFVECINVDFKSERKEKFYDLQLNIKNSKDIYESLNKYTETEILKEENLYDADKYGKQEAQKGTYFKTLPPVLFFQLIRFEYDYTKEQNIKITDKFEYYEELDLNRYVRKNKGPNYRYKLFSVLVHSGEGSSSGHYYAFIRPKMDQWFKFNDDIVEKAYSFQVFESNFGGTYWDAKFSKITKTIEETDIKNITTAYMLVYLRTDQINDLLKPILLHEIPVRLKQIEENKQKAEEEKDRKKELFKVYMTSFDILKKSYDIPGLIFFPKGHYDDEFKTLFKADKKNRYKRSYNKCILLTTFIEEITESIGLSQNEFIILKINYTQETRKIMILNKYLKNANSLQLKFCYMGKGVPNVYPILMILPIKNKERIFVNKEDNKKNFMNDENDEKNEIEFRPKKNEMYDKIAEIDIEQYDIYNKLSKEEMIVIFFKIYESDTHSLSLINYDFFEKTQNIDTIIKKIKDFDEFNGYYEHENSKFYLEKNGFPIGIEEINANDKIETLENGSIIVIDVYPSIELNSKNQFKSIFDYYQDYVNNAFVTFICLEDNREAKILLKLDLKYFDIINEIKKKFKDYASLDNELILLKAKGKKSSGNSYQEVTDYLETTLEDLVKHDDKIYFSKSKIKISEYEKKFVLSIYFYFDNNTTSSKKEIICLRSDFVKDVIKRVIDENIFETEIEEEINEKNIRLVILDSKQNKIICISKSDILIYAYQQKNYILRLEKKEDEFETIIDKSNSFYLFCSQTSKSLDNIPHPFIVKAFKKDTFKSTREKIFKALQNKKIEFEKKSINFTEEYYNKLKIYLKFDCNTPTHKAINFEDNDKIVFSQNKTEIDEKFFIEIVHNTLVSRNQNNTLKIN